MAPPVQISLSLQIMAICSAIASAQPFIPGSNCGISKPLKLIEKVPLDGAIDTSDLECSIVKDKDSLAEYLLRQPAWVYEPWSDCSSSCGGGNMTRVRQCVRRSDGATLDPGECGGGTTTIDMECNTHECPEWGEWVPGPCSTTCGVGTITDTRQCINSQGEITHDSKCEGDSSRTETECRVCCTLETDEHIMPYSNPNIRYFSVHDIDCGVGLFLTHWQLRPTIVGGEVIKFIYTCCPGPSSDGACSQALQDPLHTQAQDIDLDSSQNLHYLDSHNVSCPDQGMMSQFNFKDSGNTGWYKFACCPPPDPAVWDCAAFYTDVQDVGDGDAYFLDRTAISCPQDSYLSQFQMRPVVPPEAPVNSYKYQVTCCTQP